MVKWVDVLVIYMFLLKDYMLIDKVKYYVIYLIEKC